MSKDVSYHARRFLKLRESKGITLSEDQAAIAHLIFSKGRGTGKSLLIALLALSDDDHAQTLKDLENKSCTSQSR